MNTLKAIALGLLVTVATIALGGWLATRNSTPVPAASNQTMNSAPSWLSSPQATTANVSAADNKPPTTAAALTKRYEMQFKVNAETEIVEGIEVLKDRNCTVKVHYLDNGDGTTRKIHSCEPNEPRKQDIYDTYSTEALESLSYSDGHAAHVLSKRFNRSDPARALQYAIRSTALSGNVMPLAWTILHYPAPYSINGVVQLQSVEDKYVLTGVINAFDSDISGHNLRRLQALEHQQDGVDINALDIRIKEYLAEIERIRNEVGVVRNTAHQ